MVLLQGIGLYRAPYLGTSCYSKTFSLNCKHLGLKITTNILKVTVPCIFVSCISRFWKQVFFLFAQLDSIL